MRMAGIGEKGKSEAQGEPTSKNREESMTESGQDAFGEKSAPQKPGTSPQGDGTSDPADMTFVGRPGDQRSSSSGTTSLGGESRDADEKTGPGGVEGERDT
jgi:hypothetical protein